MSGPAFQLSRVEAEGQMSNRIRFNRSQSDMLESRSRQGEPHGSRLQLSSPKAAELILS